MGAVGAVRIRRGGLDDAPALAALRWSWSRERSSHQETGLAVVDRVPDVDRAVRRAGLVQTMVVLRDHRNRGVGGRILAELVGHARELGLDYLEVHPSERSVPFYRRLGFDGAGQTLRLPLGCRP